MSETPRPRSITVEDLWLSKSLEERLKILQVVAPDRVTGLEILVNQVLREEWNAPHGQRKDGTP